MSAEPVGDGLWTFAANDHRCLFVETDDSVIALNAMAGGDDTDALRAAVDAAAPGKPIRHVVYTVDHLDHTAGAGRLAPGATTIAHELCARVVAGRRDDRQAPVDREISGSGGVLELGGRRVELVYRAPSQATGNLGAIVDGVLFLVGPRADARYGLFNDVHFRHVARVWREFASRPGVETVVPGRGALMDVDGLRRAADYVDALMQAVQVAFAEGVPIWEYEAMEPYVGERLHDEFGSLDGFADHVGIAAIRAVHFYLMGGWGLEDTPSAAPLDDRPRASTR